MIGDLVKIKFRHMKDKHHKPLSWNNTVCLYNRCLILSSKMFLDLSNNKIETFLVKEDINELCEYEIKNL